MIPPRFYIHTFPGSLWPPTISRREKVGKTAATALSPNRFSSQFSTSRTNAPRLLSHSKAGTHSPFGEKSHTTAHTPKHGPSGRGRYHYPRHELHVHKHPRAGCQNGKLCRFWVLVGGAPEERRKPAEQRCAYARRCPAGVAAPPGCVTLLLTSICFEGSTSGGGGDRREHVPAPDRADIGVAAAQLSAEIGDGIRHDLQGVRAVPAPHGGKQIFLG